MTDSTDCVICGSELTASGSPVYSVKILKSIG